MGSNIIELIAKLKDELSDKLKKIDGNMKSFATGVGAAGAATIALSGAILALTKKFSDLASGIQDGAAGLQVSTDAYQALGYVFRQTGGDASTFETAIRGIDTFMDAVSEGGRAQADVLRQLGLSYEDLRLMNHEEQFYALSAAVKNVGDEQQRSVIAQDLFGRSYQRVLGTIMQTRGTMEEATRAFMDAGLGISAADIESLDTFGDEWETMMQRLQVAGVEGIRPFLPVIQDMMDRLLVVAEKALPGVISAAGSLASVIGFLAEHMDELIALVVGFGTAVMVADLKMNGLNASFAKGITQSKAFGVAVGTLKAIVGNLGLGLALSFTVDQVGKLIGAMADAHDVNMSLADNLGNTASLLQTAVSSGFMSAEEAAAQMQQAMDDLSASASLAAEEEIALREVTEGLIATLQSTTISMDVYISRLAGVSKGSYDAAIATVEMQRAFSAGMFGEDSAVVANLDATIAALRGLQAEAIRTQVEMDKAMQNGVSATSQEDRTVGGTGAADEIKPVEELVAKYAEIRDLRAEQAAAVERIIAKEDALLSRVRAARDEETAHRDAIAAKVEATAAREMQFREQGNAILLSGVEEAGAALLRGGAQWETQMLAAIAKMALQFMAMQIGGPFGAVLGWVGGLFKSGGEVRHAQGGETVMDSGPFGDRHPYLLERGERVIPREKVAMDRQTGRGSVSVTVNYNPTLSTASPGEALVLGREIRDILQRTGGI